MADSIHVKLPDGSVKEVPSGTTPLDIAKSISPRLADAAIAAKTNGNLIDLTRPLEKDTDLAAPHRQRSRVAGGVPSFVSALAGGCGA